MILNVNNNIIRYMKFLRCVIVVIEKNFGSVLIALAIIVAGLIIAYSINPSVW